MVAVGLSKIVMVVINVIFMLFGLAALIVGIVFKVGWDKVRDPIIKAAGKEDIDLTKVGDTAAYGAIIIGAFILVVALLGCIGACCQVRVLLALYAIVVLLLLIAEIVIIAIVAAKASEVENEVAKVFNDTLRKGPYFENGTNEISDSFNQIFSKLECCGIENYTSSFPIDPVTNTNDGFKADPNRISAGITIQVIPIACCRKANLGSPLTKKSFQDVDKCLNTLTPDSQYAYTKGCIPTIVDVVKDNKAIFIGVGVAILVLELLMVIMAFFLCCRADKD